MQKASPKWGLGRLLTQNSLTHGLAAWMGREVAVPAGHREVAGGLRPSTGGRNPTSTGAGAQLGTEPQGGDIPGVPLTPPSSLLVARGDRQPPPGAGHGARCHHRGVPGGPAEPRLERPTGHPVPEGTARHGTAAAPTPAPAGVGAPLPPPPSPSSHPVPLQVEQLFCLGLKSRVECHRVLEMFDWNLAQASSHLLDPCGSSRQK